MMEVDEYGGGGAGSGAGSGVGGGCGSSAGGSGACVLGEPGVLRAEESMGFDSGLALVDPEHREDLVFVIVFPNPELFLSLLNIVEPVSEDVLKFKVQAKRDPTTGALVSGLYINSMVQAGSMFVAAELPCDVRFNNATCTGREVITVKLSKVRNMIRRKGGSMTLVMYQIDTVKSSHLYLVVRDGAKQRRRALGTLPDPNPGDVQGLPRMKFAFKLQVPVETLREELSLVNSVAVENNAKLLVEIRRQPVSDHLFLRLVAEGQAHDGISSEIPMNVLPVLGNDPDGPETWADAAGAIMDGVAIEPAADMSRLPCVHSQKFLGAHLLKILHPMRGESEVEVDLRNVTKGMPSPMIIRVQMGERSGAGGGGAFVAFVVAESNED
jgi:hypothetical protein